MMKVSNWISIFYFHFFFCFISSSVFHNLNTKVNSTQINFEKKVPGKSTSLTRSIYINNLYFNIYDVIFCDLLLAIRCKKVSNRNSWIQRVKHPFIQKEDRKLIRRLSYLNIEAFFRYKRTESESIFRSFVTHRIRTKVSTNCARHLWISRHRKHQV